VVYDFIFTGKPIFLFVPDIGEYVTASRDFLFPLASTPFPIAETVEALTENILKFDKTKYNTDREKFLKEKDCIEDGNASMRIVAKLKEIMDGCGRK
jgi:CDP-glycerol glycerophosphotransferase